MWSVTAMMTFARLLLPAHTKRLTEHEGYFQMLKWVSSLVAALCTTGAAADVTLAHPGDPIFEACAVDMDVDGAVIVDRILSAGWAETALTPEIQAHGRDDADLRYFENFVFLGNASKQDWDAAIAETADTRDLDPYGVSDPSYLTETRVFAEAEGAGFAILTIEDDAYWSCEILLTVAPDDAEPFMAQPLNPDDATRTDGISYLSDEHRRSELADLLGLLPFLPAPKHYYCSYWLADPDSLKRRYGIDTEIVFSAQFNVASPF